MLSAKNALVQCMDPPWKQRMLLISTNVKVRKAIWKLYPIQSKLEDNENHEQ